MLFPNWKDNLLAQVHEKTELLEKLISYEMGIYMWIYLVWIIMFNSWYKHSAEKNYLNILNFLGHHFNCSDEEVSGNPLQWRNNEHDGVSIVCSGADKKTSKLHVTGLCEGNPPGFPSQRASKAEMFSFDDVTMHQRHLYVQRLAKPTSSLSHG